MRLIDADKLHPDNMLQSVVMAKTVPAIVIPNNATNGDMIMAIFNCMVIEVSKGKVYVEHIYFPFDEVWWNAPYTAKH